MTLGETAVLDQLTHPSGDESRRLLLAPVTITPTKPLTPTHIKGLLWLDLTRRANEWDRETHVAWNPRVAHLTTQTTAFWLFLDEVAGGVDWERCSEEDIGELYLRAHRERYRPTVSQLHLYLERVEAEGWVHPASARLLELWTEQIGQLGVQDPGLRGTTPLRAAANMVIELLADAELLVNHQRFGGPVYLDGSRWGLPLRLLIDTDGRANYLLPILRQLVPLADSRTDILLLFDEQLLTDYVLLDRALTVLGGSVRRLSLGRVPLGGVVRSSRHGGWTGRTLGALARECLRHVDLSTYRLGMRLYFVATLGRRSSRSFDPAMLRACLKRAERVLRRASPVEAIEPTVLRDTLAELRGPAGYVDPYRVATTLPSRRRDVAASVLSTLFL